MHPQKWIILTLRWKKPSEFRFSLLKPPNNSIYIKRFHQTKLLLKSSNNLPGIQKFQ